MRKSSADCALPEEPGGTQPEISRNLNNKTLYILYIILHSVISNTTPYTNSYSNNTALTPGKNEREADLLRSPMTHNKRVQRNLTTDKYTVLYCAKYVIRHWTPWSTLSVKNCQSYTV